MKTPEEQAMSDRVTAQIKEVGVRCEVYLQSLYDKSHKIQDIFHVRFAEFVDPAYSKGFAAGKSQRLLDAFEARATPTPDITPAPANPPSPEKLAARAREIQDEASVRGESMSNVASVRMAFEEAGLVI